MSDPRTEPLDAALQDLLDAERQSALRSDLHDVQARVRAAVKARIEGDGGDGGSGGDGAPPSGPSTPPPAPSTGGLATGGATAIGLGGSAMGLIVGLTLGLATGLPAGWLLHRAMLPPSSPAAPTEIVEPPPTPSTPEPAPRVPVPAPAPTPAPTPTVEPEPASASDEDGEQARIDRARVALRRGRPHDALVALMSHAREFPDGQLAEERDRLTIEALVAQGRLDQARVRLGEFQTRWPVSIHLAALEALFDAAPAGSTD